MLGDTVAIDNVSGLGADGKNKLQDDIPTSDMKQRIF
jgi:hypothetical protein